MSSTPCCHPDSNLALPVQHRALTSSPAYASDTSLRDEPTVSWTSVLVVSLAGAVLGVLAAVFEAMR